MKILFIEDDDEKRDKINTYLNNIFDNLKIVDKKSYHSGLRTLVKKEKYDIVLMDMSMPNFDVISDESEGGTPESFAGRKLLEQMKFRFIDYPVIVITQFESFGEHVEKLSFKELNEELEAKFRPFYKGMVYYHSSESDWKENLEKEINKILEDKDA